MKKFLLFVLATLAVAPVMAQDEIGADVTKYIINAGFDEDLTWQADGSTKQPIVKEYDWHRSTVLTAEDGSVYARGKGTRPDGFSPAWNGFIGQLKGWTMETNKPLKEPYSGDGMEWTYFGTVPYALGEKAVPIADDGSTFLAPPAKLPAASGDDNIGFLYLRAGWGGRAVYKQVVNLPCAKYLLEYWAINTNPDATNGKNLSKVTCRSDVWEDETGFNDTEWTLHTIEFTPVSEFSLQFGFESEGGSGKNPFLCIDGIKLTKIGDADEAELLESDCLDLLQVLIELESELTDYDGLVRELDDVIFDLEDRIDQRFGADALRQVMADIKAAVEKYTKAMEDVAKLEELVAKAENLVYDTDYPGKADLEAAISQYQGVINSGGADAIAQAVVDMRKAILAYYASQDASFENPADYTFAVQHPWFVEASGEPTLQADGTYYFPNAGDEENPYTAGSVPFDGSSEGWYINGTYSDTSQQRLNYQQGRTCWNAWGTNINGTLGIAQDIVDLPNGYYKVSADMITQEGYCTDQHVYGKSTLGEVDSPALTFDTYVSGGEGAWETLTTTDAIIVCDGKLTIGALGTGTGEASAGWYLVTNFKLLYCGPASDEAIAEALAAREAQVKNTIEAMHFAADKKEAQAVYAEYEASKDLDKLSEAAQVALTSENKYDEIMQEGKTIPTVTEKLANNEYGDAAGIVRYALNYVNNYIASDEATYRNIDDKLTEMKNYTDTYVPVFQEAEALLAECKSEASKAALTSTMEAHKALLVSEMKDAATVAEYVEELKTRMYEVKKQEQYVNNPDATDYTAFIQNPKAEADTGWNIDKGTGNTNSNVGQWWNGDTSVRYFDSWNGTEGALNYYGEQVVLGIPNGTYTIGADVRTSGEGAFIFGANGGEAKSDTTWVEIPLQTYTHFDDETGEEVTENATDKWGQIWVDACERFETMTDADPEYFEVLNITNAHSGAGYGWMHLEVANIEVKDHKIVIGMTTDGNRTGKEFTGTWFSVGNWTLTLTAKGDNSGWDGPLATGISEISNDNRVAVDGIYSVSGARVAKLQHGLNIVVRNGKAMKVMVK